MCSASPHTSCPQPATPAQGYRLPVPARVALLVNQHAGCGRGGRAARSACDRLRERGCVVDVLSARDPTHSEALARAAVAGGAHALVAVGGDGTVNIAVQVVVGTHVPLGIIPGGTGDDAARMLGIPADPAAAADVVAAGATRRVDLGQVDGRFFLSVLSSGFDSRVNERANRLTWPRGPGRYRLALLAELRTFRAVPYEVVLDGEVWTMAAMLVAVGNGPAYGGGMRICPGARIDDGLLDVTLVLPLSTTRFLRLFPSVYRGEHVQSASVRTARARSVTLRAPGMTAYADGEPVGPLPVTVEAVPGGLTVLVPPSTAGEGLSTLQGEEAT